MKWHKLHDLLNAASADGVFSDCQLNVVSGSGAQHAFSVGDGGASALYDIASLTKIVATVPIVLRALADKKLKLDDTLGDLLRGVVEPHILQSKETIQVRHLLDHTSGLSWHIPFYEERDSVSVFTRVLRVPAAHTVGARKVYSDLNFILLAEVLSHVYQRPFAALFDKFVAAPLGLNETFFKPKSSARCIKTEQCPIRGQLMRGRVHDPNCDFFGGVGGHAGLFATGRDLLKVGVWARDAYLGKPTQLKGSSFLRGFVTAKPETLGFDRKSDPKSSCGHFFSIDTFGHLGFTGTSLWVDPRTGVVLVFLCNRVYPSARDLRIQRLRPMVHDSCMNALGYRRNKSNL